MLSCTFFRSRQGLQPFVELGTSEIQPSQIVKAKNVPDHNLQILGLEKMDVGILLNFKEQTYLQWSYYLILQEYVLQEQGTAFIRSIDPLNKQQPVFVVVQTFKLNT
jgi:hypothetical protein